MNTLKLVFFLWGLTLSNTYAAPKGEFHFWYNGAKGSFASQMLVLDGNYDKETVFPNLWEKVISELEKKEINLGYKDFFKNCVKELVQFWLDEENTKDKTINYGPNSTSFHYNHEECSKDFCIEKPSTQGNRAWVKGYYDVSK